MDKIPILDFDAFLNGNANERLQVSKELIRVVKQYGFIYLTNHGISNDLVEKLFDYNKKFFDKPLDYKLAVTKSHVTFCGYDAILAEKLTDDRPGDLKESYMIKPMGTPWPEDWSDFKEFVLFMHEKCFSLCLQILRSFAIGLDVDKTLFDSKFNNSEVALLRLLHYPPLPARVEENQIRAGEHTDYGALTILFQDTVGGLEVKTLDNKWIPAPYVDNAVLVNVGDVMEMWTNGLLRSTPHRVVNPDDERQSKSRYSFAFFCDPDLESEIKPICNFINDSSPSKYPPKLYRDHLFGKYKASYGDFQEQK